MPNLDRWLKQSPMSDPVAHAGAIAELSADVGDLACVVQGLLVHEAWLGAYGLDERDYHEVSRATLPVTERLSRVVERDSRRLQLPRQPNGREVGTCRDFALMLCAFLCSKQIPSRVRCGFASYLGTRWEDHWVCEYWGEGAQRWCLCDPQIDDVLRDRLGIDFDPANVPRDTFMTAGEAWLAWRHGRADAADFGHGGVTGAWFMKINVVRDHYALNDRETSAWDGWRAVQEARRVVSDENTLLLDDLAARPEQRLVEIIPDWLAQA